MSNNIFFSYRIGFFSWMLYKWHSNSNLVSRPLDSRFCGTGLCSYGVSLLIAVVQSRAFNRRILYGHYLPTVILIIIGIPLPTYSFILGLIPSFSANTSHQPFLFFLQVSLHYSPRLLTFSLLAYPYLLFNFFSVLHFLVVVSVR